MFPKLFTVCCMAILLGACANTSTPHVPQSIQAANILSEKEEFDLLKTTEEQIRIQQHQYLEAITAHKYDANGKFLSSEQWNKTAMLAEIQKFTVFLQRSIDDLNALPLKNSEVDAARQYLVQGQRNLLSAYQSIDFKESRSNEKSKFMSNVKGYMQNAVPYMRLLQKYYPAQ